MATPSHNNQCNQDEADLSKLGYRQEFGRGMTVVHNWALSFSIISLLTGVPQLYGYGLANGGPLQMTVGWAIVSLFTIIVACSLAQLSSAFPTAGGVYYWSSHLAGPRLGWVAGFTNMLGQVGALIGVNLFLVDLLISLYPDVGAGENLPVKLLFCFLFSLTLQFAVNNLSINKLKLVYLGSASFQILFLLLLIGLLWHAGFKQTPSFLLEQGLPPVFPPDDYLKAFFAGFVMTQWILIGFDAPAHASEETINPRRASPRGILFSVASSAILGWLLLFAITLSITDLKSVAASQPPSEVFFTIVKQATGLDGTIRISVLLSVWLCGLASMTSASRAVYALARNNGLPRSHLLKQVSTRTKIPIRALLAVVFPIAAVLVWGIVSPDKKVPSNEISTAAVMMMMMFELLQGIVTIAVLLLSTSYAIAMLATLVAYVRGSTLPNAPWQLERTIETWLFPLIGLGWFLATIWINLNDNWGIAFTTVLSSLFVWHIIKKNYVPPKLAASESRNTGNGIQVFRNEVYPAERAEIANRRRCLISALVNAPSSSRTSSGEGDGLTQVGQASASPSSTHGLVGLALSGGGVRSATFNLGILQGLSRIRKYNGSQSCLDYFDYLSTVSGGGYIGSWYAAWARKSGITVVHDALNAAKPDTPSKLAASHGPPELVHLRKYSSYLVPAIGLLSADTWTAIATYLRNLTLNQLILIPTLIAIILIPQLLDQFVKNGLKEWTGIPITILSLSAMGIGSASLVFALRNRDELGQPQERLPLPYTLTTLHQRIILPLFSSAVAIACVISWWDQLTAVGGRASTTYNAGLLAAMLMLWRIYSAVTGTEYSKLDTNVARIRYGLWLVVAELFYVSAAALATYAFWNFSLTWDSQAVLAFGVPYFLLLFFLLDTVHAGFRSQDVTDLSRERLANSNGLLLLYSLVWTLVCSLSFYSNLLWAELAESSYGWSQNTLVGGWILTTMTAVISGYFSREDKRVNGRWQEWGTKVMPAFAVAGLLVAISIMSSKITDVVKPYFGTYETLALLTEVICCFLFALLLASKIDVNEFSMHAFYRNRLIRCYLGAFRDRETHADQITNLSSADDFPLADLCLNNQKAKGTCGGPYLLLNTALNLTDSGQLEQQERKAAPFILSPKYAGSQMTGFCETNKFCGNITLGTALAISGAALAPNRGYHSSKAIAFFLALFNVRLGWWVGNPGYGEQISSSRGPQFGLWFLLLELLGQTSASSKYVYLSDGGHFENLGLYELIRRHCKFVVCVDAGSDPNMEFYDLGNALRKIRTDFGIDIDMDLEMLTPKAGEKSSRWHHAVGTIRYDKLDALAPPGVFIYIKASLTGDEPLDVMEYAKSHSTFPHESTFNQFFQESQQESYRRLGEHIAHEVFSVVRDLVEKPSPEDFFYFLQSHWVHLPSSINESFLTQTQNFLKLDDALWNDRNLIALERELYPDIGSLPEFRNRKADVHFCIAQIQLMEDTFIGLQLNKYATHPLNRGWLNWFRRISASNTFRELWPYLKSIYSKPFVTFAEEYLGLPGLPAPYVWASDPEQRTKLMSMISELMNEFGQEWPDRQPGFTQSINHLDSIVITTPTVEGNPIKAWGIAVALEEGNEVRVLLWIRGAYRSSGIGRQLLDRLFVEIKNKFTKATACRVILPQPRSVVSRGNEEQTNWTRFYTREGFTLCPNSAITDGTRQLIKLVGNQ